MDLLTALPLPPLTLLFLLAMCFLAGFVDAVAGAFVGSAIALPAAVFSVAGHTIGSGMALKRGARLIRPMLVAVLALPLVNLASQLL